MEGGEESGEPFFPNLILTRAAVSWILKPDLEAARLALVAYADPEMERPNRLLTPISWSGMIPGGYSWIGRRFGTLGFLPGPEMGRDPGNFKSWRGTVRPVSP